MGMWPFARKPDPPPRTIGASGFKLIGHDGDYQWMPQPDLTPAQAAEVAITAAWVMSWGQGDHKNDIRAWIARNGLERHFRFTPNG